MVALRGFAQEDGDFADLHGAFGFEGAARGTGGGQVALCFGFFICGGVPGAVAGIHVMREFFEGSDVGVGELLSRLYRARLQVGVGDGGANLQLRGVGLFGAGEGGVARGVGVALFLAEEVGFPFGAEVGGQHGFVGVDFVAVRQRGAAKRVVEVGVKVAGVDACADGRAPVGVGKVGGRLGFFEAAAGDGDVGVVRQCFCDELVEDGVVPRLPPAADVGVVGACRGGVVVGGGEGDGAAVFDGGALAGGEQGGEGDEGEGL